MIMVTRINGKVLWLNPLLVESVESTPDTIVTLSNTHKYVLKESPEAIAEASSVFFRRIGLVGAVNRGEEAE